MLKQLLKQNWKLLTNGEIMLRKKRRISESIDDDPMAGLNNLSDAMLVLALGFLIFAIMALSANPDMITNTAQTQDVSSADSLIRITLMLEDWKTAVIVRLVKFIRILQPVSW